MSQNVNIAPEEAAPRRLLPERLSFLLDDRPVLWFEDVEVYDALLAEIIAAYDPGGVVEFMLVKDIADTQWECRRLRKAKSRRAHRPLIHIDRHIFVGEGQFLLPNKILKTHRERENHPLQYALAAIVDLALQTVFGDRPP